MSPSSLAAERSSAGRLQLYAALSAKGRTHCLTGLVVHAQWLGIIEKDDNTEDEEKQEKAHGLRCMQLGKCQKTFRVNDAGFADAQALVKQWIDIAPAIELARQMSLEVVANSMLEAMTVIRRCSISTAGPTHWPFHPPREAAPRTPISGAPGTPGARGMPRAPSTPSGGRTPGTPRARAAPRTPTPGAPGMPGASGQLGARVAPGTPQPTQDGKRRKKDEKPSYMASHFTRAVLLAMDESFWHIRWEELPWTISKVLRWSPDATEQCAPIVDLPLVDMVRRFGASPLWVSRWARFASGLSEDELDLALQTKDRAIIVRGGAPAPLPTPTASIRSASWPGVS